MGIKKEKILISIIIPAYNEEKVLGTLLESIKKQTYKNIEMVVVDDSSDDNTSGVARRYTNKVFVEPHAERSKQRNFGAGKSKGEYLIFLDADMELTPKVVEDVFRTIREEGAKALVIPEKTVGEGFIQKIRKFEREMYMKDPDIEVARVFERRVFFEFGGYDTALTGPEDYDLPYRISKKYKIIRSAKYILHHEEHLTLAGLLKKKYSYAQKGALYAQKHPELLSSQGNLLFRRAYLKNWRKFLKNPLLGLGFIFVRVLETISAVFGYISAVGLSGFFKSFTKMILLSKKK